MHGVIGRTPCVARAFMNNYLATEHLQSTLKHSMATTNASAVEAAKLCSLPDLAIRWKHLGLYYFYKLVNGHFEFPNSPLSLRSLNYPNRDGRSNLYVQPHASSNAFHHSFFPSTISLWNSLPLSIATAPTFNSFKRQLLNSL